MHNLGRCISAILTFALRNPDSSHSHDFKSALKCVSALDDFSLMAEYRSHTPDTHVYMERYLQTFDRTKDIFLEFRSSKAMHAETNRQDWDLREIMANQRANEARYNTATKRRQQVDQESLARANLRADLIRRENHFNFIKMYYLSHFASDVQHFCSISIYSTEIGELAHKEQIKDGYQKSNKNEAARQILSQYGHQYALGIRLQTIEVLLQTGMIMVGNSGMEMPTSSSHSAPRRKLKRRTNIGMLSELCRAHEIEYCDIMEEMLSFIKQTAANDPRLPAHLTELGLHPVERFIQLEIPVSDFPEADVFQFHRARCTGTKAFCNGGARNNWVWVQTGREESYGNLRGLAVARVLALSKIRNVLRKAAGVHRLALVPVLDPINHNKFPLTSGHIRLGKLSTGRDMRIVGIGAVIGQAHVIPSEERQWIVNPWIDLWTFNDIY